jgi:large subunit ribosomal protein L17
MTIRKLGRKKENRERTLRNVATSLILYEKIVTTEAKAKALSPMVERLISNSLKGTLAARRDAKALLFDRNAVSKLFEDLPTRSANRTSGFVRLTKLPVRPGDGASMTQMELILTPLEEIIEKESKAKVRVRKTAAVTAVSSTEDNKTA